MSTWYKFALRKHMMRFDPRVVINVDINDSNLEASITSIISSSIVKGLDVIGMVSYNPQVPYRAMDISKKQNVDLFIIPGQIYKTIDGFDVIIYNSLEKYPDGMDIKSLLIKTESNGHKTLVYNLGKQKSNILYKLGESGIKPTLVEIFSSKSYGYMYVKTNTYEVVSSGAENSSELDKTNIYSHVPRKDLENMNLLPPGQGEEYIPGYLEKVNVGN